MTSVASLSPHNPLMLAYGNLPIVAGVHFYSIMGTVAHDSHGQPSDGYVTVQSARLPGSLSDTLLPIHHRQFDRPAPLNVVYRILRGACRHGNERRQFRRPARMPELSAGPKY